MRMRDLPAAIRARLAPAGAHHRGAAARVRPYVIRTAITPPPLADDIVDAAESPVRPYVLAHERARADADLAGVA